MIGHGLTQKSFHFQPLALPCQYVVGSYARMQSGFVVNGHPTTKNLLFHIKTRTGSHEQDFRVVVYVPI